MALAQKVRKTATKSGAGQQKVVFEYTAPSAKTVAVAGSFNDWKPENTPLKKDKEGVWKASVSLPPGRYEYRYVVDGTWHNDQRPVECAMNPFGTMNCVVSIGGETASCEESAKK